ncbi:MAG: ABC transporter substrate-binding protein [Deltaproteobacteria bacterium]|nr:ABC transporter substrate-binding protein [Deltaproteobacteria bacterium]
MRSRSKLTRFFFLGTALALIAGLTLLQGEARAKDTLIIGVPSTPTGIDPDVNAEPAGSDIQGNLYDWGISLKFTPSAQTGMGDVMVPDFYAELQPALIESWEVAPDYSSCTFHLRKGVKSAWGNELTTEDIRWKTERNIALKGNGAFMLGVINCDSMNNLEIIDKYTFKVTPNRPAHLIDEMWSNLYFPIWDSTEARKHATEEDPWAHDWVATHGDGFGTYYITDWKAGQHIVLEANPHAWRGKPAFKKLIFKVIPESSSRVAMVKDGTIDVAMKLSPREIDALRDAPGVKVINLQGNLDLHVITNQAFEPFKSKHVRQAIQWAMPQDDIVKLAYYGQAIPWKATIPSMYPGVDTSGFPYSYNLEKAKECLKKGGYPEGFQVDLYYNADFAAHETTAVLIKDSLAKIGVKVNLRKTPAGSFNAGVLARKFPFSLWNDYPCIADPFYSYILMYLSTNYHCYENYNNPEADRMMLEGNDIVDTEKRYEYAKKLERLLLEDVPVAWAVEQNYTCAIRDNIKGFNWDVSNNVRYDFLFPAAQQPSIEIPH